MNAARLVPGWRAGAAALGVLACAGCAVGPDFAPPAAPATARYVPGPEPAAPEMPALDTRAPIDADWWRVFGSAELDALVQRALAGSPQLDAARARLVRAQELLAARAGGAASPAIDAVFGAQRQRIDPATFGFPQAPNPGPFNVFALGANVSYDFDVFGATRRALEAAGAEVDLQRFELEAARLVLAGNVVLTSIRIAALDAQIEALAAMLATEREQLAIAEARLAAGGVSVLDVKGARLRLAQAEAALPPMQAERAQAGHLLAVLVGEAPAEAALAVPSLGALQLPAALPLRVPSELARRRPDIRASEALLHKASANLGVATADLYPKFVVGGSLSTSQLEMSELFGNGINVWNIGLNLLQPLLRGGELKARQRAAAAAYDEAAAAYRQSVLRGLQEVADALRALQADSLAYASRSEQAARAGDAERIVAARLEAGGVSRLAWLDAERVRSQARLDQAQAQASRFASVAVLLQALGGGEMQGAGEERTSGPR